ncbi:DUF6338 family protein [Streptomyces zaomyceticus]|uniref:DUF6338 family protein n=1 Tax=Streptomyces zaomyceticus TaxID=68286 RepID=UPI00372419D9
MGGTPSTVTQLALIVIAVLPGVTYQFIRERRLGALPGERALAERILRAITASVALNAMYAVVFASRIVDISTHATEIMKDASRVREVAIFGLVLIFAIPALCAWIVSAVRLRGRESGYVQTPSAWDHVFQDLSASFVRARLKDGMWVGGWYGPKSFTTAYPHDPEIYLELAWVMKDDGSFDAQVQKSQGLLIRGVDVDLLEIIEN